MGLGFVKKKYQKFKKLIYERSKKKPISYLIKKKEFWKNEFIIDNSVLIPRPETEHLVSEALLATKKKSGKVERKRKGKNMSWNDFKKMQ